MLTHKDTDRIYIGQSTNFCGRMRSYKSYQNNVNKSVIGHAIKKHGWDAFDKKLIICAEGRDYLNMLEINAIKLYDCMVPKGFNVRTGGYDSEFTLETRKKMSDVRKEYLKNPDVLDNLRAKRKQQVITKEEYAKASAKQKQMKWMNNGVISCRVSPDKIEDIKKQGFVFGRAKKYITEAYRNNQSKNAFKQWEKVKSCPI